VTFAAFGAVVGIHVGSLPFLVETARVSPFAFGIAGALGMLTNILFMAMGGTLSRYTGHRTVLLASLPLLLAALVFALLVGNVWMFCLSFVVLSACLGTIDLFMNTEASIIEQEMARPMFNSFHATVSLSIAAFAILGSLISVFLAPWSGAILAGLLLTFAWAAIYVAIPHHTIAEANRATGTARLPRKVLTFIGIAAGANVACEAAAILWAGQLLAAIAPELAAISGLGVAFYGLCGGITRLVGDQLRARFGDLAIMVVSLFTAIAGFATLGFAPGFWLSVMAFAGVGFGLAVTFPCLFSLAARLAPQARAAALGYVAAVGGVPRVVLPWVLGWLAAQFSLGAVFAACAFVAAAALSIIILTFAQADNHAVPAK
jgi:MFS family permease